LWDIIVLFATTQGDCSFLASIHLENVPFIGYLTKATEGLFTPRGGT
jgi:1-acyl-sn-glycerol-3-phosphate acyltransferase